VNLESTGFWQDNLDIWFGSSDVRVIRTLNRQTKSRGMLHQSLLLCGVGQFLNVF